MLCRQKLHVIKTKLYVIETKIYVAKTKTICSKDKVICFKVKKHGARCERSRRGFFSLPKRDILISEYT